MRPDPTIIPEVAVALVRGYIMGDPAIVESEKPKLLRGMVLLVIRDPVVGKYNDTFVLVMDGAVVRVAWGNSDPGRVGWRAAIKKFYPRLREGLVGGMIPGHHNGRPNRLRQATAKQAEQAGMRATFLDYRGDGLFTVERMKDADTIAVVEVGYQAINWHPGGTTKTGSAGCLTNAPDAYDELRDLVYATGQPWLPIVVARGPI